ncbi:MAG: outer membrane beta-barrel family protein [Dysgonamonadaceae bacterium]|nr:outer membrane beta-barrel family protein [Dysgonamonadaceae bacterium]
MRYKSRSKLQLTVAQYLMDRKLLVSFSVEDIFNKNQGNNWTVYNNPVAYTQSSHLSTRGVTFYIRYNWGKQKSIQQKRSDTGHINRL